MIQWHYKVHRSADCSLEALERATTHWLATRRQIPGYHVSATLWGARSRHSDIQRAMGSQQPKPRPGIVSHYHDDSITLQDYDRPIAPTLAQVWTVARKLRLKPLAVEYKRSSGGKGWHTAITWDRAFSHAETVAIQMLLGSDVNREAYNLQRVLSGGTEGRDDWNLLFERKIK